MTTNQFVLVRENYGGSNGVVDNFPRRNDLQKEIIHCTRLLHKYTLLFYKESLYKEPTYRRLKCLRNLHY